MMIAVKGMIVACQPKILIGLFPSKVFKMTALIMKRQKVILSYKWTKEGTKKPCFTFIVRSKLKIQKIHWNVSSYLLPQK